MTAERSHYPSTIFIKKPPTPEGSYYHHLWQSIFQIRQQQPIKSEDQPRHQAIINEQKKERTYLRAPIFIVPTYYNSLNRY